MGVLSLSPAIELAQHRDHMHPKASNKEMLAGCVVRKKFADIWQSIESACGDILMSGWYLADAPGYGKSTALYWCVNEARNKKYICPILGKLSLRCLLNIRFVFLVTLCVPPLNLLNPVVLQARCDERPRPRHSLSIAYGTLSSLCVPRRTLTPSSHPEGFETWVKFYDDINPQMDAWKVERGKKTIMVLNTTSRIKVTLTARLFVVAHAMLMFLSYFSFKQVAGLVRV